MSIINRELKRASENELQRVIEPLANYLCATERPRTALISALEFLFNEIAQTNRAANAHVTTFAESHWS
jgi:hypothetical protein